MLSVRFALLLWKSVFGKLLRGTMWAWTAKYEDIRGFVLGVLDVFIQFCSRLFYFYRTNSYMWIVNDYGRQLNSLERNSYDNYIFYTVCHKQLFFFILIMNSEILTNHSNVNRQSLFKTGILEHKSFNKQGKFFTAIA